MKFKVDENLPVEAADILRDAGYAADTVADESLSGSDDESLVAKSRSEGRILVTLDLDFANIQAYPPGTHAGIVVLRLKQQDKATVLAYYDALLRRCHTEARLASCGLSTAIGSASARAVDWTQADLWGVIRDRCFSPWPTIRPAGFRTAEFHAHSDILDTLFGLTLIP